MSQLPGTQLPKQSDFTISQSAEKFLANIANSLQIPDSTYQEAESRYKSVAEWLGRPESSLRDAKPAAYSQGSFALGTVIKPVSEEEDYDVDMVCEFQVDRQITTQKSLKDTLYKELIAYAERYSMEHPEPDHRRCVRLNYADGAQFHLDVTPATPDGERQKFVLKTHSVPEEWSKLAVAITDTQHPNYNVPVLDWSHSNPRGYALWFRSRMQVAFDARRQKIALDKRASVEAIPDYEVKTPLQYAIQILKRHRDMTHEGEPQDKPISIILTTLSAWAYSQESSIAGALYAVLRRMDSFMEMRNGVAWIPNPTDPLENFADKWQKHPERQAAFYSWLEKARSDFNTIAEMVSRQDIGEVMSPVLGHRLVQKAVDQMGVVSVLKSSSAFRSMLSPAHKKQPEWPVINEGKASIKTATASRSGFRSHTFSSGSTALPKGCKLVFRAETNVPEPYQVYWQIVNNGSAAKGAGDLRGGFELGKVEQGGITKSEDTSYKGTHTIECFIVKNGYCLARSGQFIVNIQ